MTARVPTTPAEFFADLPAFFAALDLGLGKHSSPGNMIFHVVGEGGGSWSLRLTDGALLISPADGAGDDPIVQITVTRDDFQHLMLQTLALGAQPLATPQGQLLAFKALTLDAERARVVRAVKGSVAFVVTDGAVKRKIVLTPGAQVPNAAQPECRLECQASDFLELQLGKQLPLQLVMSGKMRIAGDAQIPLALNAVFQ